ncbi:MAG: hypothetical protein JNK43_04600 [Ignavibacteria bacterium]|nr:hypothetical protein [Ignavibacteria bacterium]
MSILKEHLEKYGSYNLWANNALAVTLSLLPEDLFITEQKSSFRTIKETVMHMFDAETIWYKRLNGVSPDEWPSKGIKCTGREAVSLLLEASGNLAKQTASLNENAEGTKCRFRSLDGKEQEIRISDILQHCFNHSTFHRGQLITMLRFCGVEKLPPTDYITFIRNFG